MTWREAHTFSDSTLVEQAFTHPSFVNECPGVATNQRLEFLGDAVLQLVVSELLLARFPDWDEGQLTKARSRLVDRRQCGLIAQAFGMADSLRTERGLSGGFAPGSKVHSDVFEAWVAAVYVDAGLDGARAVLTPIFAPLLAGLAAAPLKDVKSLLQEWCQARRLPLPVYVEGEIDGPPHARRFRVSVFVGEDAYGPGVGSTKKAAEVAAAEAALAALGDADLPP